MREFHRAKHTLPIALVILSAMFGSCEKDVFNKEKVQATYKDRFPVKDIDPTMDWKTTQQVTVNIKVYEDAGTDYTVRIYDANPLIENSSAKLLAEGTANDQMAFTTIMDCPTAQAEAYICRIDPANRSVVKLVSINNKTLDATFGTSNTTRAFTRAENNSITVYTPDRTEAEIASLSSSAKELKSNTVLVSGDVYKISKGKTFPNNIYTDGIWSGKVATVIIDGTWDPKGNIAAINTGVDVIVTGTGKIILPKNNPLTFIGSSRIIVFKGGTVEGSEDYKGEIYFSNASNGRFNYNAGTIRIEEVHLDGGGYFYNCGTLNIESLNIQNVGGKLINQGTAIIEKTTLNSTIENGCYLEVTDHLYGDLIMGNNCGAVVEEYGMDGNSSKKLIMGSNSVLTIKEEAYFSYACSFTGPTNGSALVKIGELTGINGFKHNGGNIYYEVKKETINSSWEKETFLKYLMNTNGVLSKWGESPITIPAGDCTGQGNIPSGGGSGTPDTPITYTYVFEDNYPLVGDYDFNDIVLDVTTEYLREKQTNNIKSIQLNVTLAAAGATKLLGSGLRIVNIPKSAIAGITTGGDDRRFQETFAGSKGLFSYNSGTHMEDGDNSILIPLFNNAHQVFGLVNGKQINTGGGVGETAKAYRYEIIIELTDKTKKEPIFSKDNLDFFICYQYKSMQKRMEVHLYEFWKYGATTAGTVQQENLDLAGNNTWAVCVPNFRYPKEFINISISSDPSSGAYPKFLDWARNRETNTDWYLYPNEDNVYR